MRILTLLCHFTGERDNPEKKMGGSDKRRTAGTGKESSTTPRELTNPGSRGPRDDFTELHPIRDLKQFALTGTM